MNKTNLKVLALKYRPKDFSDLIGQEYLVSTIKKSMELEQLPNAYIFTGIRGVGKTTTARIVAKMLNCTVFDKNKDPILAECDQAKAISEDRHPDVLEIDAASNTSVDNAREIIENIKYSPVMGKYKVYIIDEVHMLSKSAFNALLKTLEEPPLHSKFIFATTEISKVPITILSRCQRFDLRRVGKETMLLFLKKIIKLEKINISEKALHMIIKAGDGSVRDNLSILDQANIFKNTETIEEGDIVKMLGFSRITDLYQIILLVIKNNQEKLLVILQDMYERGAETNKVIEGLMEVTNWSLKLKINPSLLNDKFLTVEDKSFAESLSEADQGQLNILWQSLIKGYDELKISPNPHITLEMILLRCCFLLNKNFNKAENEKKKSKNFSNQDIKENDLSEYNISKNNNKYSSLDDKIKLHENFFQYYGNQFSPLMASLILENCEIVDFNENQKILKIVVTDKNFEGLIELKQNLKNSFTIEIEESEKVTLIKQLKTMRKDVLIKKEMESEDFKKVLDKFPNAKILDIQELEGAKQNDG
tara:strand:- start:133 stop:1737 length:1605 start_codon:yes stop_codon:yes gene_type:complete